MGLSELLVRLLEAKIDIGPGILWREVIGNVFGLASATTFPVQAPTVGMNGRPIVRPLNHWWLFMISTLVSPGGA